MTDEEGENVPSKVYTPLSHGRGVGGEASPLSHGRGVGGEAAGGGSAGGWASSLFCFCRFGPTLYAFGADSIFAVEGDSLLPVAAYPEAIVPDFGIVARAADDGIYFADAHSVFHFDGQHVKRLSTGANLIRDILIDRWGRLWVATYEGVFCYFNCHFTNYTLSGTTADAPQADNDVVRTVALDADGRLVMGTMDGRLIIDGEEVATLDDNYFLPSAARIGDKLFLPTRGDVARLDGDALTWLHLPSDRYQFVAEANGRLIVGTRTTLLSYDVATAQLDTIATGMSHPWCAATDGDGVLWAGSSMGLSRLDRGSTGSGELLSYEGRKLVVTTLTRTPSGDIIFASTDSLYRLHHGTAFSLNDQIPQLAGHEIRSLHATARGQLVIAVIDGLYVCRLDDDCRLTDICWFDHRNGFTLLEPQMATMAESADGTVYLLGVEGLTSFQPEALLHDSQADTVITPPLRWWQHWWAVGAAGLLALALIVAIVVAIVRRQQRRRIAHLRREKRQKELQVSAIRLKAIPHFHTNVLAGIEYFLMNDDSDDALRYLKLYSDFASITLTDSDRAARTVAEEVDYTRMYLALEQLRYGDTLRFDIDVASDVDVRTLLPNMLIYTYAQNAVKHGIAPKPGGGRIDIRLFANDGNVVVSVEDDGIGREAAERLSRNTTKQGLSILMEQIGLYNQTNRRHIRQVVTDLRDADGRPAGTRYEMTVPAGFKFE